MAQKDSRLDRLPVNLMMEMSPPWHRSNSRISTAPFVNSKTEAEKVTLSCIVAVVKVTFFLKHLKNLIFNQEQLT